MAGNLHELVEAATTKNSGKIRLGYTVDSYAGVLAELGTALENMGFSYSNGTSLMGDDYSRIGSIVFDEEGFSSDPQSALWKLEMGLIGSLPITYNKFNKKSIAVIEGNDETVITNSGNLRQLPFILSQDKLVQTQDTLKFESGVYVNVRTKLVNYLNRMYTHGSTVGGKSAFTEQMVMSLIEKRCLMLQFVNVGSGVEFLICGQTPNGENKVLVNTTIIATSIGKQLGITLNAGMGENNNVSVIPESSELSCPIENKNYNSKTGYIDGLTHKEFNEWYNIRIDGGQDSNYSPVILKQMGNKEVQIRIYIPENKKEEAKLILPQGVSENIFSSYVNVRTGGANVPAAANAQLQKMFDAIDAACNEEQLFIFRKSDLKDSNTSATFGALFGKTGAEQTAWISGDGQDTAMKGEFYIPLGWPMCVINQNYGMTEGDPRTVADQKRKGLISQQNSSKLEPWIICVDQNDNNIPYETRMDASLNSLDSSALNGTKDKEWYNQRLQKANTGRIKIHCQSNGGVSQKFNELFGSMWRTYSRAAEIYNTGRPVEEKISAGEIILRCAPCLCAINGSGCLHRSRWSGNKRKSAGHDTGQAIDFDPNNNPAGDRGVNLNTHFVKGMECAYRPLLHHLYRLGGGWGGSYRFMKQKKYDSMHIQF